MGEQNGVLVTSIGIEQFEKFYVKEQMKVVCLEELPLTNEGGFVMADVEGFTIAIRRTRWDNLKRIYILLKNWTESYRLRMIL